ncbi:hypothetical protein SAPIO_CDS0564 [Scedosporium apiospermum]|uniref:NADH dehydrogenase [ubiquinone] iron-sulfur protein 5 n=1 Tax=Pseudallescheria apiosperma TaxID=563466 RepID=A0A084GHA4_PSEDA|nr:uncharacterized protein SAPIO_CDS0564 [Scedosporium apiospermum]KEZ46716.1 hypothetical protein SAPIO_CDS0564 [Scedosporium apiospermum]
MASGYGYSGGPGRCFPFWQEVLACYVVNSTPEDRSGAQKCGLALEDYYECLHHKKEAARVRALQDAYRKAEAASPRDNAPTAGEIRSLGLIGRDEVSKKVLES